MTDEEYQQRTERRIDSLLEVIEELNAFVDLIAADVEWWEGARPRPRCRR